MCIYPRQNERRRRCFTGYLRTALHVSNNGEKIDRVLNVGRIEIDLAGFVLDYLEARHALTLAPIDASKDGPIRLLVAARLGKTRLIDNVAV